MTAPSPATTRRAAGLGLMAGIPVYVFMKWRAAQDSVPTGTVVVPVPVDLASEVVQVPVGVGQ